MNRGVDRQALRIAVTPFDVAIVGGGFAGSVVAAQLARHTSAPLRIVIFDRAGAFGRGAAYSPASDNCILNVRANAMGAFPDCERDFLRWLRDRGYGDGDPDLGERFLPRRLYGDYLCDLLERSTATNGVSIEYQLSSVTEIVATDGGYVLSDDRDRDTFAKSVVLALGNLPPSGFGDESLSAALARHAHKPWDLLARGHVDRDARVVIVGTGLSALDILLELHACGHRGTITMLSRHGRLPLVHAPSTTESTAALAQIGGSPRDVLRSIRRLVRDAASRGRRWQEVLDGLRPQTNRIWQSWTSNEKRQFDRHLASLWGIHRHRAPPATLAVSDALVAGGQLRIVRGRLIELRATDATLQIRYADRDATSETVVHADLIVDCTGPPRDIRKSGDPLIAALFARGLVRSGSLGLGFAAGPDGTIHRTNSPAALFALGTPLRGTLCESSAVREVRIQARAVAEAILASADERTGVGMMTIVEEEMA